MVGDAAGGAWARENAQVLNQGLTQELTQVLAQGTSATGVDGGCASAGA